MKKLEFRKATKDDIAFVALCTLASTGLYDMKEEISGKLQDIYKNLVFLCSQDDTLYSYVKARIAMIEGKLVGAIVGYDGTYYAAARAKTFGYFKDVAGMDFTNSDMECDEDEFYLDCLAVLPQFRGKGLGLEIIQESIDKAKLDGHKKIACMVDMEEPELAKYYETLGFRFCKALRCFNTLYNKYVLTC